MASAQEIAQVLGLQEHREGGMFRELYRSVVRTHATKQRRAATSIFYMLRARDVSTWHLVKSDEIWMYHAGSSAIQLLLLPLVVGITYEFNRYVGGHDGLLCRILRAPGMWMQNFTTNELDDSMIECAIRSLELVLPSEKGKDAW